MVRLRASVLVARSMPDYYGQVNSGLMLRARRQLGRHGWLSFAVDALTYRYVDNATLVSEVVSFGPPTLAYHHYLISAEHIAASAYVRVLLPLDTARGSGVETGPEAGATAQARLGAHAFVDAGVGMTAPIDLVGGQARGRFETVGLAELWYVPRPAAALFGGASVRGELAPDVTLVTAVPRAGIRVALRRRFWTGALVEVPVGGQDRTDLIVALFVGVAP